jgi:hypothetical protein
MYKATVAVCSQIRTKHSTQSEHHVGYCMLNQVARKETARNNERERIWKESVSAYFETIPRHLPVSIQHITKTVGVSSAVARIRVFKFQDTNQHWHP